MPGFAPPALLVYSLAALAEIGGCFCFWAVFRLQRPCLWLLPGMMSLALFGWLLTLVDSSAAGRAFAAYGGIYIIASVLWMWLIEKETPGSSDLAGAVLCLAGAAVILFLRIK